MEMVDVEGEEEDEEDEVADALTEDSSEEEEEDPQDGRGDRLLMRAVLRKTRTDIFRSVKQCVLGKRGWNTWIQMTRTLPR